MLAIERRQEILKIIQKEKSVRVQALAVLFDVAEETIRRDLDKMDKEGKLKKTHGGAVLEEPVSDDLTFSDRQKVNMEEKKRMAVAASQLIEDGETVFIDMSTTALEVIKAVDSTKQVTVVTNSLEAIVVLGHMDNIKVVTIGGTYDKNNLYMGGAMCYKYIDHYYVDKTFFSVKGMTLDRGLMDSREEIAQIKALMVKNCRQAILMIDSSKFDKTGLVRILDPEEIDVVVTEEGLDDPWKAYFNEHHIETIIAE